MGVYSEGAYGIPAGLIYSLPVTCDKGEWRIVQGMHLASISQVFYHTVLVSIMIFFPDCLIFMFIGLKVDDFSRAKMEATANELVQEKNLAYSCLNWVVLSR